MRGALTAGGLGAALLLAGGGFASPSLLVPGLGLVALAVGSWVWVSLAARRLRLDRATGPPRIVEGEPYPLRIEARGGVLPPPGGELQDPLLDAPVRVGPRWGGAVARELELHGRGARRLDPATLRLADPLALCERTVRSAHGGELLVLPRIEQVLVEGEGGEARLRALAGLDGAASVGGHEPRAIELEVDGLRPHRHGSPASRIHWPTVARTGELLERRLVAGADAAPLVVLDAGRSAPEEALDAAVRAAGSLIFHLAALGGCAALLPGDRRTSEVQSDLRGWPAVHARLARAAPGPPPATFGRLTRSGAVFWVSAHSGSHPAPLRSGGGLRYLVTPGASAASGAFEVAGCSGVLIGGSRRGVRARRARVGAGRERAA